MSELERLRERAEALEVDAQTATAQLEAAKQAQAEALASAEARAQAIAKKRTTRRQLVLVVAFVVLPVVGVLAYTVMSLVEPERLVLTVRGVEGPAPARLGETCSLQVQPAYFPYNALLKLDCGGQRIYGFESFGQLTCEVDDGRVTACLDDGDIEHGGDPRVRLDRSVGRMTVDDGDRWRIELSLDD